MRFVNIIGVSVILLSLLACESKERVKAPASDQTRISTEQIASSEHVVVVKEVIQAKSYTYLKVAENADEYWIATAKQPLEVGMKLSYDQGLEMRDFTSKELDRTFASIWFVSQMNGTGANIPGMAGRSSSNSQAMVQNGDINITKAAGGVTIQELYANRSNFEGKTVSIRGQVTKFNPKIMGRNWVHIQDGTGTSEHFDLTITTMAQVAVGDVVTFRGTIALNKDFGAGYKYDLIMEQTALINEN